MTRPKNNRLDLRCSLIFFLMLTLTVAQDTAAAQGRTRNKEDLAVIDLLRATPRLVSKGRVQDPDYNHNVPIVDEMESRGGAIITGLIGLVESEERLDHQVLDFWPNMKVGDLAFVLLVDLFADGNGKPVFSDISWTSLIETKDATRSSHDRFYDFVNSKGRDALREKLSQFWENNQDTIGWNQMSRNFVRQE